MNEPFISKGTTIFGIRTTVIQEEIKAIRDGFTEEQKERLLMDCARQQWFTQQHAEYWQKRYAEKTGKAHF